MAQRCGIRVAVTVAALAFTSMASAQPLAETRPKIEPNTPTVAQRPLARLAPARSEAPTVPTAQLSRTPSAEPLLALVAILAIAGGVAGATRHRARIPAKPLTQSAASHADVAQSQAATAQPEKKRRGEVVTHPQTASR